MAFEEQLARSRSVFKKLAEVSSLTSENKTSKKGRTLKEHSQNAKAVFKWMLDQLHDGRISHLSKWRSMKYAFNCLAELPPVSPEFDNANGPHSSKQCAAVSQCNGASTLPGALSAMSSCSDKEIIDVLVDMVGYSGFYSLDSHTS
jgi:hypothetical protein